MHHLPHRVGPPLQDPRDLRVVLPKHLAEQEGGALLRGQPLEQHEQLFERFLSAIAADDAEALLAILAPDVVLATDGGGRVNAARRLVVGADHVARFALGVTRKFGQGATHQLARLNGQPALLAFQDGVLIAATMLEVEDARIRRVYTVLNPDKLRRVLAGRAPVV